MLFLRDIKRRNAIIVSIGIMLLIVAIGFVQLINPKRTHKLQSKAKIESVQSIRSIPGGLEQGPTKEYIQLQQEHNQQQAQQASQIGQSFIATIVDGTKVETSVQQPEAQDREKHFNMGPVVSPLQRQTTEVEAVLARQDALLSEQKTEMLKQQLQGAMNQQAGQLIGVWSSQPLRQEAITGIENQPSAIQTIHDEYSDLAKYFKNAIKAGNVLRGILLTSVNSDAPGPILAKIITGDLKEAQLIGTLSNLGERVLIQFHKMNLPDYPKSISIHAVAVDASKADVGLASYTDRHLMLRYGSLFASGLVEGYGLALQRSRRMPIEYYDPIQTVEKREQLNHLSSDNQPSYGLHLDHTGKFLGALGQVGSQFSSALAKQFYKPATVHVYAGTGIGILFMEDLSSAVTPHAQNGRTKL